MADGTKIEWADSTWQIVTGCSVVSPGCTNCYAMKLAGTRLRNHPSRAGLTVESKAGPVWNGEVRFNAGWLDQPLRWARPRRVFVCAHGDLFHESVPDEWIDRVFAVMALCPRHKFQVLTKRSSRMRAYVGKWFERLASSVVMVDHPTGLANFASLVDWNMMPTVLPNVWLGVSAEDQTRADERIPDLLATPAAVRFVSLEPLLGPIDLHLYLLDGLITQQDPLDWVIVGGESGPGARPMHPDWPRAIRDQCAAAGVSFFFKQHGEWAPRDTPESHDYAYDPSKPGPSKIMVHRFNGGREAEMLRFGKKRAGRLLDGIEHNGMPA